VYLWAPSRLIFFSRFFYPASEPVKNLSVKTPKTAPAAPFGYRPENSPLHRCPAVVKLLALLFISAFAYGSAPALGTLAPGIAALGISLAALAAGIRPWELLRGSRPLLLLALFLLFLRAVEFVPAPPFFRCNRAEIPGGLAQGLSMIVSFAGGALLFAVTTMRELRDGLGCGPRGKRRALPFRFGLALSLMLGFLPRFFEIWEETNMACEARGAAGGVRRLFLVIPPAVERMIEKALDTALALEGRGLEL
jgi:biotin transport system permease protein